MNRENPKVILYISCSSKNPKKEKKRVFFFKTWSNRRQRRKCKSVCDDVVWCGNGFSFGSSGILCLCDFGDDGDGERKLMWNRGRRRMKSMRTRKKTRPPLVYPERERLVKERIKEGRGGGG